MPIADMLTHLPPLPLILDYGDDDRELTLEDEKGIFLALRYRRRVRCIRLCMPVSSLRRLVAAMNSEFPILEKLCIMPLANHDNGLSLPETFKAPHLRHFALKDIAYSLGMFHHPSPILHIPTTERIGQFVQYYSPQLWRYARFPCHIYQLGMTRSTHNRSLRMFTHILDDDSLLNIFYFCQPVMLDDNVTDVDRILEGGEWARERWWYQLAHVCRKWRSLILGSASHLRLNLLCTYGTPVADMLTHSPLPLVIDYLGNYQTITAEEEEGIMLALQLRDRVRRIRLRMPLRYLQKLTLAIDKEFPMLEYLYIGPPIRHSSGLMIPDTFQAPHLHHLILSDVGSPIVSSPSLITGMGLITLSLQRISPSAYLHPNDLLQQLSLLPYLESLEISFHSPVPSRDVERQLLHRPVTTHVTLPNLRWFGFRWTCAYMEALLPRMTTPRLEGLKAHFFLQLNFSVPHLLQFMNAAENLRFGCAKIWFVDDRLDVYVYPHDRVPMYSFFTEISCGPLDWQVASAAHIFHQLRTVFSSVEHLTIEFLRYPISSETNNEADHSQWRELLMLFGNVKTLCVENEFLQQVSRCLQGDDEESPMALLPELKELEYSTFGVTASAFKTFIDARQNAGHPITLVLRRSHLPLE